MNRACPALAAALVAVGLPALGAPHEINVFTDELEAPGGIGFDLHVNYARGRDTPDFDGEIPPDKAWRLMPELVFGLPWSSELGLHVPLTLDSDGEWHADGLRVRVKHMLSPAGATFFAGVNVEYGNDEPHLSEDRHNLELRGIFGYRSDRWLVAFNPILAWVVTGTNKSGRPDLEASLKVAREVAAGWSVGIEHYAGYGRVGDLASWRDQDQVLLFAVDYEGKKFGLNFGIGGGLTPASDDFVVKAIFSFPIR